MKKTELLYNKNLEVFNAKLLEVTNTRAKNYTSKKVLHGSVQNFLNLSKEFGSTINYAVTMTFPGDVSFKESWDLLPARLSHIKKALSCFPLYSCVLGVEIHKKRKQKVISTKKLGCLHSSPLLGRPHIHMCLTLYNDFLCPTEETLSEALKFNGSDDLDLKLLSSAKGNRFAAKNWFFYCTKELLDPQTQEFVKSELGLESSSFLWFGDHEHRFRCERLSGFFRDSKLNLVGALIPNLFVSWMPLVPFSKDDTTKVSIFVKKLLELNNRAIWTDRTQVCKLISGAKASWMPEVLLSDFYTSLIKSFPVKGQELLNNSRSFNLYIRDYSKLDFNWLPRITVATHLVELSDGIYDFRIGELSSVDNWGLTSCASYWLTLSFNNLPWPQTCLDIADRVVTSSYPFAPRSENFVFRFADLFHCKKQNDKVIYLHGLPGVGKSALIEQILKLVAGSNLVVLSNKKDQFQYDNITEGDILFQNEFVYDKADIESTLSLAEGAPLVVNRKYRASKTVNLEEGSKKHLVIASNETPRTTGALARRLDSFYLKQPENLLRTRVEEIVHDKNIVNEAVSFCIFCNIIRFRSLGLNPNIPASWEGKNWSGSELADFSSKKLLV
jgi:hypothetical protein